MPKGIQTLILLASLVAGLDGPAIAGSVMHQSPKLYRRVRSPCRDGEVMKRTGGGGRRGVLSCAPGKALSRPSASTSSPIIR